MTKEQNIKSKTKQNTCKLEDECSESGKMQQMRRPDDASQSLQSLRKLQQERDYQSRRLMRPKNRILAGVLFFCTPK